MIHKAESLIGTKSEVRSEVIRINGRKGTNSYHFIFIRDSPNDGTVLGKQDRLISKITNSLYTALYGIF